MLSQGCNNIVIKDYILITMFYHVNARLLSYHKVVHTLLIKLQSYHKVVYKDTPCIHKGVNSITICWQASDKVSTTLTGCKIIVTTLFLVVTTWYGFQVAKVNGCMQQLCVTHCFQVSKYWDICVTTKVVTSSHGVPVLVFASKYQCITLWKCFAATILYTFHCS